MKADEMELSLELSIGGCYTKSSRNQENDINESNTSSRSSASESYVVGCVQDEIFSSDSADPFKKREIQALRRREAIKKREEKQKRWATRGRGGGGGVNERIQLEMQQNQARVVDRERRENESCEELLMKMDNRNNNGARKDIPLGQPKCFKVVENGNNCRNLDLEQGNGNGNGLIERSSSAFLDYQTTTSQKGSSSTETGSPSNYSRGGRHHQQLNATAPTDDPEKSDLNGHSSRDGSDQANGNTASLLLPMTSSNIPTPECAMLAEQRSSTSRQCNKPVIKPMTPQGDKKDTAALPRMPLVSTTGNGPNGTTVNGLLYSYSKSEVSIVCVCHGTSFSPAEFVEHAGGVDISHPLKHITIVPTHFG